MAYNSRSKSTKSKDLSLLPEEARALSNTSFTSLSIEDLDTFKASLRKEFGKQSAIDADDFVNEFIPSGIEPLDYLLGGGAPAGKWMEIVGREGTGKSTMGLHMLGHVQNMGGLAAIIDTEGGTGDKYRLDMFKVDPDKCIITMEDLAEKAFVQIERIANYIVQKQLKVPSLVILDSLAGLTTAVEQEAEIEASQVAITARMIKKGINRVKTICNEANLAVIMTNQSRVKIGGMSNPFTGPEMTSPGGDTPKFQSITRLFLDRGKFLGEAKMPEGHVINTKIIKCKTAPSLGRMIPIRFYYDDRGFSNAMTIYDILVQAKLIPSTAWKTFDFPGKGEFKINGEKGFEDLYNDNKEYFIGLMKDAYKSQSFSLNSAIESDSPTTDTSGDE
mgnify:FL=1